MGLFDKFNNGKKYDGGKKTEEIKRQREQIKDTFRKNLGEIGFTTMEINEVIDIINVYDSKIELAKMKLIGTNINNPDPSIIMKEVHEEIRNYQLQMASDIKDKVEEIKQRKQNLG